MKKTLTLATMLATVFITGCMAPANTLPVNGVPAGTPPPVLAPNTGANVFNTNNAIIEGLNGALKDGSASMGDMAKNAALGALTGGLGVPATGVGANGLPANGTPVNPNVPAGTAVP